MSEACAVCLEAFTQGGEPYLLDCQHTFHAACLVRWFQGGARTCPLCRAEPENTEEDSDEESDPEDEYVLTSGFLDLSRRAELLLPRGMAQHAAKCRHAPRRRAGERCLRWKARLDAALRAARTHERRGVGTMAQLQATMRSCLRKVRTATRRLRGSECRLMAVSMASTR